MRDVLLARIKPLVDRFADRLVNDLVDLEVARIELELARIPDAFEAALSAYASDVLGPVLATMMAPPAPPIDSTWTTIEHPAVVKARQRDVKPENYPPSRRAREERTEPQANGKKPVTCTKCGFVGGNARGCGTAHPTKDSIEVMGVVADPVRRTVTMRVEGPAAEMIRRGAAPFSMGSNAGIPEIQATPATRAAELEGAHNLLRQRLRRPDTDAAPMTAIVTERRLKPTPEALAAAKARIARIAERNRATPGRAAEPAREHNDNENADERWSAREIDEERRIAESSKHAGELPAPSSSFVVTAREGRGDIFHGAGLGDLEEV